MSTKIEYHNCNFCGIQHESEACSQSGEYLDYGYCSAECFYKKWMNNPKRDTFATFTFAKNYKEAQALYQLL